ncbi:MAG: caspase family protein [Saprospirales bacterium]|nr:caspase family protein [Saprospirales bacterium]
MNAGDIAFVHFTGHGLQIPDNDGDEPDGMDEALVLFDSRLNDDASLLRDDQMWALLEKLCEKAGPSGQVLVLIDACHAGGGARGKISSSRQHRQYAKNSPDKAPLAAFFACLPHERSFQIMGEDRKPYGPLTYAFCLAMQQATPQTTYRSLFEKVVRTMAGRAFRQTPEVQGELDILLFGGRVEAPPPYFTPLVVLDETRAMVRGGLLNGLHPGTEVVLYPVDTRDTVGVESLAKGFIIDRKAAFGVRAGA